jgi:hypothetical protein
MVIGTHHYIFWAKYVGFFIFFQYFVALSAYEYKRNGKLHRVVLHGVSKYTFIREIHGQL